MHLADTISRHLGLIEWDAKILTNFCFVIKTARYMKNGIKLSVIIIAFWTECQ